jgi:hypothetical protein
MAKQTINIGSVAGDGTGDPLRTAFNKANGNFDELYTDVAAAAADAASRLAPSGDGSALTGLTKTQVGLANVDNTSDLGKPISTATQTALDGKLAIAGDGSTLTGLTKTQVGLANVDNTSDLSKPISTATQTALDGKLAATGDGSALTGLTKTQVGLANVDNTSDLSKPISTATQTALDLKAAAVHTHVISDVTGLQSELDGKAKLVAVPATATDVGAVGDYAVDASFAYYYIGDGTTHAWVRAAVASW